MPERSSLKPAPASLPTLCPQGTQTGKPAMPLGRPFTLLGSRNRAHLHLVSSTISRNHACIIATDNGLYIRDLASRSGVIVNGRRVKEADLRDGDTLQIGSFKFKFGDPAGPVRFPLTPKAAAAVLDIGGGAHTPLDSRTLLIGRRPTADIPVNNASISNTHALLFEVNGQRFIRDLGSRTGTLVNGKPVHHQLLEFGDEIKIGEISCRFLPAHGQDQPHLDEGFVEPQLDEDEPIGLDFGAHEPVVHASKNGELAPIPLEDLDEAPLRLVNAAETMGEPAEPTEEPAGDEPVSHEEPAHAAAEHVAVSDDQDVTIPPTPLAAAGEPGLDFLAEEAVRMPVQPLQVHAPEFLQPADHALETAEPAAPASAEAPPAVEPPPGQPAEDHHLDEHVLPDAEEQVLSEAPIPSVEPETVEADAPALSPGPSQFTVHPADALPLEPEPEPAATPVSDVPTVASTAEPIEVEPTVDHTAEVEPSIDHTAEIEPAVEPADVAPEPYVWESAPTETVYEPAPTQEPEALLDDDIAPSPVEPVMEESPEPVISESQAQLEPVQPEPVQPGLQSQAEVQEQPEIAELAETVGQTPAAPVVHQVDLSAMRFDEPATVELAPEAVEPAEPEAPQPLLDLPPEPIEEPSADAGPETATPEPAGPEVSELAAPAEPEIPGGSATPIELIDAAALSAAPPVGEAAVTVAAAAVELASSTLEPPPEKPKRRSRSPRGKTARPASPLVQPTPPDPATVEAAPAPKRRRGSRKKPAADRAPQPVDEVPAAVEPATDLTPAEQTASPEAETPAAPTESLETTAAESLESTESTEPEVAAEATPEPEASDSSAPVETSPLETSHLETSHSAPGSEAPPPVGDEPAAHEIAQATDPVEPAPAPIEPPPQIDGESVRFDPLAGAGAAARTAPSFASEWSHAVPSESQSSPQSFSFSEFAPTESDSIDDAREADQNIAPDGASEVASEVLESTDPTPESALDIEPALDQVDVAEASTEPPQKESSLSDTAFGQVVQEFAGTDAGSLVEETLIPNEPPAPSAEPAAANEHDDRNPGSGEAIREGEAPAEPGPPPPAGFGSAGDSPSQATDFLDVPEDDFDFDVPEPDLAIDLSDTPAERAIGAGRDSDVAPQAPPAPGFPAREPPAPADDSLSSTESIAPTRQPLFPSRPAANEAAPAPPAQNARPTQSDEPLPPNVSATPPPAAGPSSNPFLGMSRDMDSFIGGMPLSLGSPARAVPLPASPASPPRPSASEPPLTFADEADPIPPLDLSISEEPLELFDGTLEKLDAIPDSLGPASKLDGTLVPEVRSQQAPPRDAPSRASQPIASAAPPPAQRGVAKPMRQVAPPPPPRTSPLRSFTGGQAAVPPPEYPSNVSVTPPFGSAGPPPPQRLTAPATREVDVFSNTAFPPLDPTMFGIGKRPAAPAQPPRKQPAPPTESELMELSRTPRQQPVLPNRQPPPKPVIPEPPPKRPWYKSLRILLPLMILAILLVIVIVIFFPPRHTVQGSLQLQGLNRDDVGVVRQTAGSLRNLVAASARLATGALRQRNMDGGFLADPEAVSAMTEPVNSPFDEGRSQLQFRVATRNVEADQVRMSALLSALYAQSGSANDDATRIRGQARQAEAQLTELQSHRTLQDELVSKRSNLVSASAGPLAPAMLLNPRAALRQVQQDDEQLRQTLADAAAQVQRRREALRLAQAKAAQSDQQAAAELGRLRQGIDDLTGRLDAVRLAQSGQIDEASRKFSAALDDFSAQLVSVPASSDDAKVTAYLSTARSAVEQVRRQSDLLTARAGQDAKAVEQLRREIADRREAHLRQVWAGDSSLQQLLEQRNAESHQYNAAVDSGYSEEAAKIKGVLEDLDHKIDARRSALATGGQFADDLQQNLQAAIERMESDRQQDERELAARLKLLEAPADVPALAKLSQGASSLIAARQAYGSAAALSATEADTEARRLQGQIAERQARLDTLRQDPSNRSALDAAQNDLDAAQAAEAKVSAAYTANQATLSNLRQLVDATADAADLADRVQQKQAEIEQLRRAVAASPMVVKPDDASVSVVYAPDTRVQYMVAGVIAVLLLFAGPLWMSFGSPDSHIPLAGMMVESYEVPGHEAGELPAHDPFEDQHPAAI